MCEHNNANYFSGDSWVDNCGSYFCDDEGNIDNNLTDCTIPVCDCGQTKVDNCGCRICDCLEASCEGLEDQNVLLMVPEERLVELRALLPCFDYIDNDCKSCNDLTQDHLGNIKEVSEFCPYSCCMASENTCDNTDCPSAYPNLAWPGLCSDNTGFYYCWLCEPSLVQNAEECPQDYNFEVDVASITCTDNFGIHLEGDSWVSENGCSMYGCVNSTIITTGPAPCVEPTCECDFRQKNYCGCDVCSCEGECSRFENIDIDYYILCLEQGVLDMENDIDQYLEQHESLKQTLQNCKNSKSLISVIYDGEC